MSKFFKNVTSFENLKAQFKGLLKENHPDNGGDVAVMQEINSEYDALFRVWKDRQEKATGKPVQETADSTRMQFYTAFGWEGKNHDWNRSLKDIAVIVRSYVKEKYPTYKFSVRTEYASMCQELHVALKESPIEIYKTFEELTQDDKHTLIRRMQNDWLFQLSSWSDAELKKEFERIWIEKGNLYKCLNEAARAVIEDVDSFVNSYNYEDCDGMIDYFHVDFYYFGCVQDNGVGIKIVPRTARLGKSSDAPAKKHETANEHEAGQNVLEEKTGYSFHIHEDTDTRDGSAIWVVKIKEQLSKEEYIRINKAMQTIGGYYSRFKHGFLFRFEPSEKLKEVA